MIFGFYFLIHGRKKKHHKRRLINSTFFKTVFSFLKIKGKVFIATDSSSYLINILSIVFNTKKYRWTNDLHINGDIIIMNIYLKLSTIKEL